MATLTRDEYSKLLAICLATYTLALELNDELEHTKFYRQKLKQKLKAVNDELEELTNNYHLIVNEQNDAPELETQGQQTVRIVEKFVKIIKEKDLELINAFFDSILNGEVAFMDGKKHKKILNQLEKI